MQFRQIAETRRHGSVRPAIGATSNAANVPKRDVRFAAINGHRQVTAACPKSADIVAKVFLGW
jgi:hypothetical protein